MKTGSYNLWEETSGKQLLLVAMSLALMTHGVIIYYTLPKTYDAFVHMFFADHYARFWFEPWDYRWYTGFLTISYPPLVHQLIALLSKVFPLKVAFSIYGVIVFEVLIVGIYRFSKIFFDKTTAGIAAILAVVLSSLVETLHVFGQVPTLTGIGFLLNALPFLYQYLVRQKTIYLVMALALVAIVVSSHHVTAIFGMVFFIAPTIFMAVTDGLPPVSRAKAFFPFLGDVLQAAFRKYRPIILFGVLVIILAIGLIFPYWYWSKTDPITQVSIPHGSRDDFLERISSGLVFYIIPLILVLALLPAISYTLLRRRRFLGWSVSFFLCLLLGSGDTTPLPKIILGDTAFNILTLDRFGFWASIIAIPFMAKFLHSFLAGPVRDWWIKHFGNRTHFILSGLSGLFYFLFLIFIFHLGSFRPLQPKEVEIKPIQNFLNRDEHMRWRYLTLGFGDQMAWLSANSLAATVDGNYHSARRLPELTSRPVERLENAKFNGPEGLASLHDFLTKTEKYSLKYVFSNDRYYDPLLYYTGWSRTIRLENGIMVWEKGNVSTIKPVVPTEIRQELKYAWGIFPLTTLIFASLLTLYYLKYYKEKDYFESVPVTDHTYPVWVISTASLLPIIFFSFFTGRQTYELLLVQEQKDPVTTVTKYFDYLDFQEFEKAFGFFQPTPVYTLDQYLLEKSVSDGGLLPSYAKLDSISVLETTRHEDSSEVKVHSFWNTSLGIFEETDTMQLIKQNDLWYILPPVYEPEIPEEQVRSYTYTIFKKQGKRVISSFPTVKDDRVKKPFAAFRQVNLIRDGDQNFLTGELLNADNIPINIGLRVKVRFENGTDRDYFPQSAFHYNIAPKASSFFQINLEPTTILDSLQVNAVEVYADTDLSERGYIHGGSPGYSVAQREAGKTGEVAINTRYYNQLTTNIDIPGILVAEKDEAGRIWQARLVIHPRALRSGLHTEFTSSFEKIQHRATVMTDIPLDVWINGQARKIQPLQRDELATQNQGIAILPHCFISPEIYLQ